MAFARPLTGPVGGEGCTEGGFAIDFREMRFGTNEKPAQSASIYESGANHGPTGSDTIHRHDCVTVEEDRVTMAPKRSAKKRRFVPKTA